MKGKRILLGIIFSIVLSQFVIASSVMAAVAGRFLNVVGEVKQLRAGLIITPMAGSPIIEGDIITTGAKAEAALFFNDESTIKIAENSKFEVREFAIKGDVRKGIFSLAIGRLIADVKKYIGGNSRFDVHSPTAVAGVRGTGFEMVVVMVGTQTTTTVVCTSGVMSISAISATGAVISTTTIVAGQTAVVTANGITVSATAAAGAGAAGAGAGGAATAGITAGTVAVGVAAAAAAAVAVSEAAGGGTTTTHHTTTSHH